MKSICVAILLATSAATAQTWSLAAMADASPLANPNGPWLYLWGATSSQLLSGPAEAAYGIPGEFLWSSQQGSAGALCDINATGAQINFSTFSFGPGVLRLDPQNSSGGIWVRFVSPLTGSYRLQGEFNTCDSAPHAKHISMVANNGQFGMPIINRDLTAGGQTFNIEPVNLTAGRSVDWIVTSIAGDGLNLSTCLSITATYTSGCYANCDNSTGAPMLNVADFTCFLQKFAQGDPYANCDNSTSSPVLNVADFTCFLQKFAQGCP